LKGRVLIPCDGNPTCRMLNVVFPGTLRDGTFYNDAIVGERILYELDSLGVLLAFAPLDRAPLEKIAEYAKSSPRKKPGRVTDLGFLPPDDPIYSIGPVVNGREIGKPYRKMTPEEIERNFQVARDEIARGNRKPSENN